MILNHLEAELVSLEERVNKDVLNHFGEIDYKKLMDASGSYDDYYLNSEVKVNCANAVASLIAAKHAIKEGDIEGTVNAIKHVTHFWTLVFSSENQRQQVSEKMSANASKGHKENNAKKEQAIQYYRDNRQSFTSKDKAAEKMAAKYSRSPATVRGWLRGI